MVSDDLDRIERELTIRLPGNYRALVLTYPHGLGPSGPDYELLDDPAQIVALNRSYRAQVFFDMPWRSHFFSFGGDGNGNAYYLDLRKEPSPVYFADHEGTLLSEQWPSLEAWLEEMLREQAEIEKEVRVRAARKAQKRWWEFWV